jgi:CheY-like chemotaxis protein
MQQLRPILLVEDNIRDAELTLTALRRRGLANEVEHLQDGAEALDYLYRRGSYLGRGGDDPIVILLDLKMPKVDGLEVLETLKADDRMKSIPVVMLTSSREEADLVRSYRLGVNAYVVKPVNFQAFLDAVHEVGAFWGVLNEAPPLESTPGGDAC